MRKPCFDFRQSFGIRQRNKKTIVRTALISLNDTSITIRAWAWVSNNSNAYALRYDVLESIKKRFDKEGIEIPFPYRTIVMKKEA